MFRRRRTPFSSMTSSHVSNCDLARKGSLLQCKRTMRDRLDFGGGAHGLIGGKATLGVDQVGREDGVDKGGLAQTSLSCIRV
jgi:hypothetical protein